MAIRVPRRCPHCGEETETTRHDGNIYCGCVSCGWWSNQCRHNPNHGTIYSRPPVRLELDVDRDFTFTAVSMEGPEMKVCSWEADK